MYIFLLQRIAIAIHLILLFAYLIELGRGVEIDHVKGEEGALLDIALHACVLVDEGVDDVAISVRLLCRCNRGVGGIAADAIEGLARPEIALCDGDALAHGAVQGDDGRLTVDDDLRHTERCLKVAEVIGTV